MRSPAVKQLAERRGIPVQQPLNFKNTPEGLEAVESLSAYGPDLLVVAAYGLILPQRVLDVPSLMPVNVHASLLPKYRGAAPIQRAIINGETVTGVTIMRMEAGLDTGPILMQRAVGIGLQDTSATLHDELAREGGDLLVAALERLSAGALQSVPQDGGRATYAQKLTKSESALDFRESARALHARIRGLTPWPGAVMKLCRPGQEDILVQMEPGIFPAPAGLKECAAGLVSSASAARPGSVLGVYENALLLSCGDGTYAISSLRPAGKKTMDGRAFFNGYLAGAPEACFIGPEE